MVPGRGVDTFVLAGASGRTLAFGPGHLAVAHSDEEQISLEDIRVAAEFLALFLLRQTGTLTA